MKHLEIKEKFLGERTRKADLSFRRNGRIDISARVSNMLALQAGDVIDIAGDGREYYLYVRIKSNGRYVGRHTAQCYPSKKNGRNFRAYSKKLCEAVLSLSGGDCAKIVAGSYEEFDNLGKAVIVVPQMNLNT